jgi:pSer/pThr/pTyr-binding forkhead associated (FHA) protein
MDPPRLREAAVAAWASRVVPLHAPVVSIGRAITNNLVLPDDPVSAQHCRIERQGKTFRLIDLGSRNKTWVNGDPVEEAILRHGDQIRIGRSTFIFEDEVSS